MAYLCVMVQESQYIYYILCLYFYIINISYDKTYFTCILINQSRLKIIITSDYIENMKIT